MSERGGCLLPGDPPDTPRCGVGIAVQAANGLGPDALDEIVDTALHAWPA